MHGPIGFCVFGLLPLFRNSFSFVGCFYEQKRYKWIGKCENIENNLRHYLCKHLRIIFAYFTSFYCVESSWQNVCRSQTLSFTLGSMTISIQLLLVIIYILDDIFFRFFSLSLSPALPSVVYARIIKAMLFRLLCDVYTIFACPTNQRNI